MRPGREEDQVAGRLVRTPVSVQLAEETQASGVEHVPREHRVAPLREPPAAGVQGVVYIAQDLHPHAVHFLPVHLPVLLDVLQNLPLHSEVRDVAVDQLVQVVVTTARIDQCLELHQVFPTRAADQPLHIVLRSRVEGQAALLHRVYQDRLGDHVVLAVILDILHELQLRRRRGHLQEIAHAHNLLEHVLQAGRRVVLAGRAGFAAHEWVDVAGIHVGRRFSCSHKLVDDPVKSSDHMPVAAT
mmetsp:Transcript_1506/g.3854  ORF Transcript_1506/g.3854 Transcript_1506/m.3854 type:complete len:243 (-) Transcript_1506:396-1124(-)